MIYVKTKIKDEKMLIQPIQNQNSYTIPKATSTSFKGDKLMGLWSADRDGVVENTNKYAKEIADLTGEAAGLKERLKHLLSIYKNNHI